MTAYFFSCHLPHVCVRDLQRISDKLLGHPPPGGEKAHKGHREWLLCLSVKCSLKKLASENKRKKNPHTFICLIKAGRIMGFFSKYSMANYITCWVRKEHLLARNSRTAITSGQKLDQGSRSKEFCILWPSYVSYAFLLEAGCMNQIKGETLILMPLKTSGGLLPFG